MYAYEVELVTTHAQHASFIKTILCYISLKNLTNVSCALLPQCRKSTPELKRWAEARVKLFSKKMGYEVSRFVVHPLMCIYRCTD